MPLVEYLFKYLTRKSNSIYPIPKVRNTRARRLLLPLTDWEEHDQYEDLLYMNPFVKAVIQITLMPLSKTTFSPEYQDNSSESTKDDLNTFVKNMQQLYFEDPRINKKIDERAQAIQVVGHPTQTRHQNKKRK